MKDFTGRYCPYCWLNHTVRKDKEFFEAREHSWTEWANVLANNYPPGTKYDFVGGEPTIFEGFYPLVSEVSLLHPWAVTTNMISDDWMPFASRGASNCVGWTVSWHRQMPVEEFIDKCLILKNAGYPVSVNVVDNVYDEESLVPELEKMSRHFHIVLSPNEPAKYREQKTPLTCCGGWSHVVITPSGDVFRCLTQVRHPNRKDYTIGNIFDGWQPIANEYRVCYLECDEYYILSKRHTTPDMFGLRVGKIINTGEPSEDTLHKRL